jgi:glycosyltransferase involved in cell wall biosynthesis
MKIAMFGVKGIPCPAGAENVAEQLGVRLAAWGHDVTVYVRPHYTPRNCTEYRGIHLVHLPSIPSKNMDAITHSFLACLSVLRCRPQIAHIHAIGSSVFALPLRAAGIKTVVQSHGLDWQRAKWGKFASTYLRMTDYTAVHFPDTFAVVSHKMKRYYEDRFHHPVEFIPNGVDKAVFAEPKEMLKYGLQGRDYIFFAARLVPEKGLHYLIEAYRRLPSPGKKLVIAGDGSFDDPYAEELKRQADENILFLGFVRGRLLQELLSNAYLFVLPSEIEGLSTGLLEAMSYGDCVLVSDIEENCEAVGDVGVTFKNRSVEDLAEKLQTLLLNEEIVNKYGKLARSQVDQSYNWDDVARQYERLYTRLLKGK